MVRDTGVESVTHAALGLDPVIHVAALLVSSSPYTDVASRVAVAKLRLDGTPTPRSWVARMTKRPTPTGDGKGASGSGGPTFREYCNAPESFLRVVWPRPPHALDPGEEIARGRAADHQSEGRCRS
jgi:hypothetical protein